MKSPCDSYVMLVEALLYSSFPTEDDWENAGLHEGTDEAIAHFCSDSYPDSESKKTLLALGTVTCRRSAEHLGPEEYDRCFGEGEWQELQDAKHHLLTGRTDVKVPQ